MRTFSPKRANVFTPTREWINNSLMTWYYDMSMMCTIEFLLSKKHAQEIVIWYSCHSTVLSHLVSIQGGPEELNTYDQWFQENEGQNENVMCIIAYETLFPARWHQDHLFWRRHFDSKAVFLGKVIFNICHFCLKSQNWCTEIVHCLASPGKVSVLALKKRRWHE